MSEKRLMNINELSKYLAIPKGSLYYMRFTHKIPQDCIVRFGTALRFDKEAIDKWINAKKVS